MTHHIWNHLDCTLFFSCILLKIFFKGTCTKSSDLLLKIKENVTGTEQRGPCNLVSATCLQIVLYNSSSDLIFNNKLRVHPK